LESGGTNDTTAPSGTDNAIFNGDADTNAVMTGSVSLHSLQLASDYTHQVNASGATITLAGDFEINNGTFVAPSDFIVNEDFLHNGGTFTANGGIVRSTAAGATHVLSGSTTFYNLSFTASGQLSPNPPTLRSTKPG
jgi:phage baseplate assembly protein gpV